MTIKNARLWIVLLAAGLLAAASCKVKGKADATLNTGDKTAEAPPPAPEPAPEPAPPAPPAPEPKKYTDAQGNEVELEGGDRAFADAVIEFKKGKPFTKSESDGNGDAIVGPPDFKEVGDGSMVSIGCGGSIVVHFEDNVLSDGEGPDLHIFEVGPQIEAFKVEIAVDDKMKWKKVGVVKGQPAQVDISAVKGAKEKHRYVRLTDTRTGCKGDHPGSDLDAIGTYRDEAPEADGGEEAASSGETEGDAAKGAEGDAAKGDAAKGAEGDAAKGDAAKGAEGDAAKGGA